MDIVKYLKKLEIDVRPKDNTLIFKINKVEKIINKKELEQYLFICLVDFIKEH